MATIIYVHGTGVRDDSSHKVIEKALPDRRVDFCFWGKTKGVKLNRKGAAIPSYEAPYDLSEEAKAESQWEMLYREPLFELLQCAALPIKPDDAPPNEVPPWAELKALITNYQPSKPFAALLKEAQLFEVWDEAHASIIREQSFNDAVKRYTPENEEPIALIARAMTANAIVIALQRGLPLPDADARDAIVDRLARDFGQKTYKSFLEKAVAYYLRPLTWIAERKRTVISDGAFPAAGDILLYQRRGDEIRRFIQDDISLATTSISGEGASDKVKQFVLFASSVGEPAEHDKERKTSVFSAEVLQLLKQSQPNPQSNWPNLNRMRADLIAHFRSLKEDKRFRFNQTPACLRWQWPDEDDGMIGAEIDAQRVLRYAQARRVYDELRRLDNYPTEESDEAYRLTVHPRPRNKFPARGLEAQVEELALMQPRKPEELPPLFEFAVRLEDYSPNLIGFVKNELEQAELPLAQLVSLRNRIKQDQQHGLKKPGRVRHILFDLGSDQIECWDYLGDQFENHHWLESSKDTPGANISKHLNRLESNGAAEETLFLEFFVRFDEDEVSDEHNFDQWEHDVTNLGSCYPVAVRWRDRTIGGGEVKQSFWREKTRAIKERAVLEQAPPIFWLPHPDYNSARLMPYLKRTHDHDCIGFLSTPVGLEAPEELRKTMRAVLLGGAPYALWPRREPADQRRFKNEFEREISTHCLCVDHLPNKIQVLREEAVCHENHFCSGVTLLWDDPDRDPVNCDDFQLEMPE